MKLFPKLLTLLSLTFFSNMLLAADWATYFPTNKVITAKVMELSSSKEIASISEKLKQGIAKNQEWFKQYINKADPGKPLPYHANLGVTEAEYAHFLKFKDAKLQEVGTVKLEFLLDKNQNIVVKTEPFSPVNGLIIGKHSVTTPLGVTNKFTPINNRNQKSLTGAWTGVQWSLNEFDDDSMQQKSLNDIKGKAVKLAVGKLEKTGEGILYYDVKDIDMSQNKKTVFSYIIYYPLY
jgi:hypothetical protein